MMSRQNKSIDTVEDFRLAFRCFDKDADGNILIDEIRTVCSPIYSLLPIEYI